MKTMTNAAGREISQIKLGDHVTICNVIWESLDNLICVVLDTRYANGIYSYTVAPINGSALGYDAARTVSGVFTEEVKHIYR